MQTHGSNGTSSDEQPTQEINLEQQSTLPMVVERQDLEQQPTQPMAVEQKNLKQQMALPRRMRIHPGSYMKLWWWVPLLAFVVLIVSVLIGRSAIESWFSHNFARNESPTPEVQVYHPLPNPTQTSLIDNAANSFMHAMMHKDWATM